MTHHVTFDSKACPNGAIVPLASGHISENEIAFINEKITVHIEAKSGALSFCDADGTVLLTATVPLPTSGDEKFSEVKCAANDGQIRLGFPQYTYQDNYPHCDGEHDRWEKSIASFTFVCYDVGENSLIK